MIAPFVTSLALLTLAGLLIDQHRRAWSAAQDDPEIDEPKRMYAYRQYRRRMLGSSLIGAEGALIAFQPIVPHEPVWISVYVAALVLGCLAIVIAGLLDALAGAKFYRRARLEDRLKQAALAFELEQRQRQADNSSDKE